MKISAAYVTPYSLALGATVALGLGRFSYALLLPAMRADLGWNYSQSGGMNTANAVGYLLGALFATIVMRLSGVRLAFISSLLMIVLALCGSALSEIYGWLVVMRLLAGAGGAVAFIAGGVLISHLASSSAHAHAGQLLGVYYAGVGFGIVLSGVSLPFALEAGLHWRWAWVLLAGLALLCGIMAAWGAWRLPEPTTANQTSRASVGLFWTMAAYFCFAVGYIAYMTFSVAFIRQNGANLWQVALFWATLGMATMVVPRFWAHAITTWQAARGMAAALFVVGIGAALPLFSSQLAMMLISALCFGSFLSVVASTTALTRRYMPPSAWSAGIALFTVVFALGQSLGPVLSGWLSDGAGLQVGLAWSAGIIGLGMVLALLQAPETFNQ